MSLKENVINALGNVIDPETSLDVIRMRLIRNLKVNPGGIVSLIFRPSSVICPMAFQLGANIQEAVKGVEGVKGVKIEVENFINAETLKDLLNE